jgi:hypothetical protein
VCQAPVLTDGHRCIGFAAVMAACFVVAHVVTVIVTCATEGFGWGLTAWLLDMLGLFAAAGFGVLCRQSSNLRSSAFRKNNGWIGMWAGITLCVRVVDTCMLFGWVRWDDVYVTPVGPVLWSNVVSELVVGVPYNIAALVGALLLVFVSPGLDQEKYALLSDDAMDHPEAGQGEHVGLDLA